MVKCAHLFLVLLPVVFGFVDYSVIENYINYKLKTYLNIAMCGTKIEMVKMMEQIYELGVTGNVVDITHLIINNNLIKNKNYGIIFDGDCPQSKQILKNIWKDILFAPSLLVLFQENVSLTNFFEDMNLNIISDVNVAVSVNHSENLWIIYDVYNPAPYNGGQLVIQILGYHVSKSNNLWPKLDSRYMARKNMTGLHFTSAVVIPEFDNNMTVGGYCFEEKHRGKNSMHRFQCILMTYCQDFFNYTVTIERTDSWGYVIDDKNTFDGLVGLLQRKEVDFGCSPLIFREDRLREIDYSYGAWVLKSVFIFRPPTTSAPSFTIFTRPLGIYVWWSLIGSSLLVVVCLKIVLRRECRILKNFRTSLECSWSNSTLIIFGILFSQGTEYNSSLTSGRIIVLFMSILAIMIYQFYSGYIVSFLLKAPHQTINDLQDLLNSSLDAGIEDILIDRDFIRNVKDEVIVELFEKKCLKYHSDGFYLPEDGLKLVMNGKFAFHVETSSAYPIIKNTFPSDVLCELQEVQMYRTQMMYTNLQKKSPFRDIFNYCILRMVENGVVMRMRQIWDAQKPQCLGDRFVGHASVGIQEFSAALYIFLYGVVLSLVLLVMEILWNKYSNTIKHKKQKHKKQYKTKLDMTQY